MMKLNWIDQLIEDYRDDKPEYRTLGHYLKVTEFWLKRMEAKQIPSGFQWTKEELEEAFKTLHDAWL